MEHLDTSELHVEEAAAPPQAPTHREVQAEGYRDELSRTHRALATVNCQAAYALDSGMSAEDYSAILNVAQRLHNHAQNVTTCLVAVIESESAA